MLNQYQILNQFPDAVCTILQQYTDTKKSNRLLDQAEQDQHRPFDPMAAPALTAGDPLEANFHAVSQRLLKAPGKYILIQPEKLL